MKRAFRTLLLFVGPCLALSACAAGGSLHVPGDLTRPPRAVAPAAGAPQAVVADFSYAAAPDGVVGRWVKAGTAGWRLDVMDNMSHGFLRKIREATKAADPEALVLLGEWTTPAANEPDHVVHGHVYEHPAVPDLGVRAEIEDLQWLHPSEMHRRDDLAPLLVTRVLPALE